MLEQLLGPGGLVENFEQRAQPALLAAVADVARLLEQPVGGDAVLGLLVHVAGADLDLDAPLLGPDHRGMQRAVAVGLGRADIVLEAPRHHRIGAVHDAERPVALLLRVGDDAKADDVGQLLEGELLALHLLPDGIGALFAARDGRAEPLLAQGGRQGLGDPLDHAAGLIAQGIEPRHHGAVAVGVELGEGEVLEFRLEGLQADALGERRVDLHGLLGDPLPLLRVGHVVERAHVVQPVGELDEEDADVLRHGEQELAQVLGLARLVRLQLQPAHLGHAIDEARRLLAEEVADLLDGGDRVLDGVVEQRGRDRRAVELELGQDAGDLDGMGEVGVAAGTGLRAVRLHREDVGAIQQSLVRAGLVALDALDEFVLPDHCRRCARPLPARASRGGGGALAGVAAPVAPPAGATPLRPPRSPALRMGRPRRRSPWPLLRAASGW